MGTPSEENTTTCSFCDLWKSVFGKIPLPAPATIPLDSNPEESQIISVIRSPSQTCVVFLCHARARPDRHNYPFELPYQRSTRSARSVFQRLALPTPVSISNGIRSA